MNVQFWRQTAAAVLAVMFGVSAPLLAATNDKDRATGVDPTLSAASDTATARINLTPSTFAEPQAAPDWQQKYDSALAQKSSGKKKMLIGLVAMGGGVAVAALAADRCVANALSNPFSLPCENAFHAAMVGGLIDAAGAGIFVWGLVQFVDGNGELNRLDAQKAAGRSGTASLDLTDHQSLQFTFGSRQMAAYRVTW